MKIERIDRKTMRVSSPDSLQNLPRVSVQEWWDGLSPNSKYDVLVIISHPVIGFCHCKFSDLLSNVKKRLTAWYKGDLS